MATTIDRRRFGTTGNVRATLVVFAVSLLLMAAFLSADMQSYAYDLPVSTLTEQIVLAADTWHGWMEELGAAGISDAIASWVSSLHDAHFVIGVDNSRPALEATSAKLLAARLD